MKRSPIQSRSLRGWLFVALAATVVGGLMITPAVQSQQAGSKKPAAANAGPVENKGEARASRRLPQYYARVVTPAQKEQIYAVQAKYQEQIDALEEQLKAVIAKRNAEIEAMLTPEQKETLATLKAEAEQRSAAKKQAAEAAPAQPGAAAASPANTPAPATAKKSAGGN